WRPRSGDDRFRAAGLRFGHRSDLGSPGNQFHYRPREYAGRPRGGSSSRRLRTGRLPAVTRSLLTAYLPYPVDERAGTGLFCFHHAGGTASAFRTWRGELGPAVAVLPVQLPGRERRAAEPRFTQMAALVADLDRHLDGMLDPPYAFYGHSMGAIV